MSQSSSVKKPKATLADAHHEAAHAVVSVRCGLPLASTDIRRRVLRAGSADSYTSASGTAGISTGYTALAEGSVQPWIEALPDPTAERNLIALAIQCAAGVYAEGSWDHPAVQDDLGNVVQIAAVLGIGTSGKEQAVRDFIKEAFAQAVLALDHDDGAAWDRVTVALLRKGHLSGDEVRAVVSESDRVTVHGSKGGTP